LKNIKRYNTALLVYDISSAATQNPLKWNFKQIGSNDADKFYLFALSAQIKGADSPNTDHDVYHIAVVPRHASSSVQKEITKANAQANTNTNFLEHNVCFKEKTTAATACPTPTKGIPEDTAQFFMQVVSVANHNTDN